MNTGDSKTEYRKLNIYYVQISLKISTYHPTLSVFMTNKTPSGEKTS